MARFSPRSLLIVAAIAVAVALSYKSVDARRASGRSSSSRSSSGSRSSGSSSRGSWGSSGSSGRSPPSRSSWGLSRSPAGSSRSSQSRSSSRRSSSPSRGYGSSPWGSSSPSGSRISAKKTGIRVAGNSAIKSSAGRPKVNMPVPSYRVQPAPVAFATHTTIVNNYYIPGSSRNLLLSNSNGFVNGYLLGTMMERSRYRNTFGCCYGCGCYYTGVSPPWYYHSYVPYRYSYSSSATYAAPANGTTYIETSPRNQTEIAPVSPCILQRWNMELPFSELPNMILTFLSSDNISGASIPEKSKFLYELVNASGESYGALPNGSNVFDIPSSADLSLCNFQLPQAKLSTFMPPSKAAATASTTPAGTVPASQGHVDISNILRYLEEQSLEGTSMSSPDYPPSAVEEPIYTGIRQIARLYSNLSADETLLTELVTSAKRCFDPSGTPTEALRGCLDFSISAAKIRELDIQNSIFGDETGVCRRFLNPDIQACSIAASASSYFNCSKDDLLNILVFVRNFYVCSETLDPSLIAKLESLEPTIPDSGAMKFGIAYGLFPATLLLFVLMTF